jgi:hypothetical protein
MANEREIEITKTQTIQTFKARIKASKPHFVPKVMAHKTRVEDALYGHFRSYVTVFVPKLKPSQTKPVCMLHLSNGGGQCMIRCKSPDELAQVLRTIANEISSEEWFEKWQTLEEISESVGRGEIPFDDDFVDIGDFKKLAGIEKSESCLPGLRCEKVKKNLTP